MYRPPKDWRVEMRDSWKLKYLSASELLMIRNAAVKYLEISNGRTIDPVAYNWLNTRSNLPGHIFSTFNHFVFEVSDVSQLLKIPK